jgi:hypothetical protein
MSRLGLQAPIAIDTADNCILLPYSTRQDLEVFDKCIHHRLELIKEERRQGKIVVRFRGNSGEKDLQPQAAMRALLFRKN